jgi:hypothetical protein
MVTRMNSNHYLVETLLRRSTHGVQDRAPLSPVAFAGFHPARSRRLSLQLCVDLRTRAFIPRPSRVIVQGMEAKGHVGIGLA